MTLATSVLVGAGVATGQIRAAINAAWSAQVQTEIKAGVEKSKDQNVEIIEKVAEVKTIANGNTERMVQSAADAAYAKGKAEVIAVVGSTAPDIVSSVVTKVG